MRKDANKALEIILDFFLKSNPGEATHTNVVKSILASTDEMVRKAINPNSLKYFASMVSCSLRRQGILTNDTIDLGLMATKGIADILSDVIDYKVAKYKSDNKTKRAATTKKAGQEKSNPETALSMNHFMPDVPENMRKQILAAIAAATTHAMCDAIGTMHKSIGAISSAVRIYDDGKHTHYIINNIDLPIENNLLKGKMVSIGNSMYGNGINIDIATKE